MAGASVTNNIGAFIAAQERKMASTLHKVLILGGSHASMFTPIDTSALLNSAYRNVVKEGTNLLGTYGYRVKYAKYVHDPNVRQRFRRTGAKKEFLKLGFEEAKPLIDRVIQQDLGI